MENNQKNFASENNNNGNTVVFAGEPKKELPNTNISEDKTITFNSVSSNTALNSKTTTKQNTAISSEKNIADDKTISFNTVSSRNNIADDKTITFNSVSNNTKSNIPTAPQQNMANDGIVFAYSEKSNTTSSIPKQKKKFPVIPVVSGSAAVVCIAVVATLLAVNFTSANTNIPESSVPAASSISSASTDNSSSTSNTVKETSFEITEVDTTNILFSQGVTVEGVDLTGMSLSDAYEAMGDALNNIRDSITITIKCDGKSVTITENDFEFDTNVSDVLIQAYHYSRNELVSPTVNTSENNGITDFSVTSVINSDSIDAVVKKVAEKFDIPPIDAHVESFNPDAVEKFTYAAPSNGYLIDQDELKTKINDILSQSTKTGSFSIETVETPYTISLDDIKANTKLIASHSTTAMNVWASNYNMELALKSANGVIVEPGETFSFNATTGDTTTGELGYVPSTAIVNGKYEQQYGGGICQASTTLYLCALKADMEVVERYAHQFPSSYAARGLDATVDYGNLDMKFKNTGKYAIYIATYTYDYDHDGYDELMVEMYGSPSTEYDEIVPVGWVTSVGSSSYSARGAKVYFKDGKEIGREYLPSGNYDFHGESVDYIYSLMPSDISFGPTNVSPTYAVPTVYSPGGCGSNTPIPYGTAGDVQKTSDEETSSSQSSQTTQTAQTSLTRQSSQTSQISSSPQTSSAASVSSNVSETSSTVSVISSSPVTSSPSSSETQEEESPEEVTQPSDE